MNLHRKASGWQMFDYPVELVWRALTDHATGNLVDPMSESEYNKTPQPGTVYTRALGSVINQQLAFEIKTSLYTMGWDVKLHQVDRCQTKVTVTLNADFTSSKAWFFCRMGLGLGGEIRHFFKDLEYKLRNVERKLKIR